MYVLWVAAGGALGSVARYLLSQWIAGKAGEAFAGTLAVNLLGSFLLALIVRMHLAGHASDVARVALGVGVMGGFTTYSSFSDETLRLLQRGDARLALGYAGTTLLACLLATVLGDIAGVRLSARLPL